jgi:prepilin-type N-terminal cleavage/methylation domain-containing protein
MNYEKFQMKKSLSSFIFHRSSIRHGFTLLEVMLVVVIILIATGIAIPSFRGTLGSTRMKDAVRSTVRVARYARSMAILHQEDCTLSFATNRIMLSSESGTLAERRLPDEIEITNFENLADNGENDRKVIYYSSGMNDGFELTMADEKNRRYTITCDPITGTVEVEDD